MRLLVKERIRSIHLERAQIYRDLAEGRQSVDFWEKLKSLESEYRSFLIHEEITWRLKSRVIWLNEGDKNTRFFLNFASSKRRENSI